jgi:penicillin-binding protein 1A
MMESVVKYGTGWRAKALGRPVAGKTGTTNEYRDAWFVGYTTNIVTAVWVGFDNTKPLGSKETGAQAAAPIWVQFMKNVLSGDPEHFSVPESIISCSIDPSTGLLSKGTSEEIMLYFKEGTEPKEYSPSLSIRKTIEKIFNLNFD